MPKRGGHREWHRGWYGGTLFIREKGYDTGTYVELLLYETLNRATSGVIRARHIRVPRA